ncbi:MULTISPECIES: hypothetical protein [unclassified Streptomyces]|uniref:hypothetical protein n=1 Tax=unclassified Streptomyces TaxID=2593676 RepID=UPI0036ECBB9C
MVISLAPAPAPAPAAAWPEAPIPGILTTGRTVSTNGKPSPGSDCQGGNLPEDHGYGLKACLENHDARACSTEHYVHS